MKLVVPLLELVGVGVDDTGVLESDTVVALTRDEVGDDITEDTVPYRDMQLVTYLKERKVIVQTYITRGNRGRE